MKILLFFFHAKQWLFISASIEDHNCSVQYSTILFVCLFVIFLFCYFFILVIQSLDKIQAFIVVVSTLQFVVNLLFFLLRTSFVDIDRLSFFFDLVCFQITEAVFYLFLVVSCTTLFAEQVLSALLFTQQSTGLSFVLFFLKSATLSFLKDFFEGIFFYKWSFWCVLCFISCF